MAGFNDFLGAIRFGMGLVSGFTHQAQQERQANETQQLALLKILKDQQHNIVSIDPSEVQQSGGVLGALFGAGGGNTFSIGGRGFKVVPKGLMFSTEPRSDLAPNATPATPPLNYNLKEQEPSSAPTAPTPPAVPINAQQTSNLSPGQQYYSTLAARIGQEEGLTPEQTEMWQALLHQESGWNPKAVSVPFQAAPGRAAGTAKGLGQLIDETAARYNVKNPFNPEDNLRGSARYIKDLFDEFKNPQTVWAAYHAGEGSVREAGGDIPNIPATQAHVRAVAQYAPLYQGTLTKAQAPGTQVAQAGEPSLTDAITQTPLGPQVAGRATLGVAAPTAPLPFSEKEMTLQQKLDAATLGLKNRFYREGVVKDPKETDRFLNLETTLHNHITQRHFAEVQKVQKAVTEMLNRQQGAVDPRIVDLADRVENESQLRDFKRYLAANAMPDILAQKLTQLGATPLEQRPQKAVELSSELFGYGYKPERLREAFKPYMAEVDAARTVQQALQQHQEIAASDLQKRQAALTSSDKLIATNKLQEAANVNTAAGIPETQWQQPLRDWREASTQRVAAREANLGTAEERDTRAFVKKQWVAAGKATPETPYGDLPVAFDEDVRVEKSKRDIAAQATKQSTTQVPEATLEHLLDPATLRPIRDKVGITWGELEHIPVMAVSPVDQKAILAMHTFKAYADDIKRDLATLQEGPFKGVTMDWAGRNATAWRSLFIQQTEANPELKRIQERLNEWGTKTTAALEGLGSRPAAKLLEPALKYRPSMETNWAGVASRGLAGKIPDTPDQILAQINGTLRVADDVVSLILFNKTGEHPAIQSRVQQRATAQAPAAQAPAAQAPAAQAPAAQAPAAQRFTPAQNQYFNPGKP